MALYQTPEDVVDKAELTESIPENMGSAQFTTLVKQLAERGISTTPDGRSVSTMPGLLTLESKDVESGYERYWISNGELLKGTADTLQELDQLEGDEITVQERMVVFDLLYSLLKYNETHQALNSLH